MSTTWKSDAMSNNDIKNMYHQNQNKNKTLRNSRANYQRSSWDSHSLRGKTSSFKSKQFKFSYQLSSTDRWQAILKSNCIKIIDTIITVLILYMNDFRLIYATSAQDFLFSYITIAIMIYLFIQIIIWFIADENGYGCSLTFWINIIALCSLIINIHFFVDQLVVKISPYSSFNKIFTTSVLHMIIGIRILMLGPKWAQMIFSKYFNEDTKFEKLWNHRVNTLVLLIIVTMIILNPNWYYRESIVIDYDIQCFEKLPDARIEELFNVFKDYQSKTQYPIIHAMIGDNFVYDNVDIDISSLRKIEVSEFNNVIPPEEVGVRKVIKIQFDNRYTIKLISKLNLIKTSSILVILIGGMFSFNYSTKKLAIEPIKKMTQNIKNLSDNPVAALQQNMEIDNTANEGNEGGLLETKLLEKTVTKICGWLSLGFGEAGAEIISTVMKKGIEADMNPMIPGKKVMGIYGFCDIRNFTDTTEVLQEKVMIFVNEVAEIVHEITAEYLGSANKNIGDAFLMVWKISNKYVQKNYNKKTKTTELVLLNTNEVNQIMDMAWISFIKIIIAWKKSKKIYDYTLNKDLNDRMPNYAVKLGFGLHVGYSIEGAIGSMFKIDASYLSPNVDMSAAIQEKTKDYGKELIWSDQFVKYLSPACRKEVRQLDEFKDYKIYTVDMDLNEWYPEVTESKQDENENYTDWDIKMRNIKEQREKARKMYDNVLHNNYSVWEKFANSDEFKSIRKKYSNNNFLIDYNQGFEHYLLGNWEDARTLFEKCLCDWGNSAEPSIENLLAFMKRTDFKAGSDWKGFRVEGVGH